jgi:parallel beta-helix repeat protein
VVDNLIVTSNIVLQPGTYTVDDVGSDGVLQIAADNITLDGTGVVIRGKGFRGYGIQMNGHTGLTLRNFNIQGYNYGILIQNASNVLIENSDISSNRKDTTTFFLDIGCGGCYGGGILFRNVTASTVRGNTLTNESTGLEIIDGGTNKVYNNLASEGPEGNELRQDSCWGIRLDHSTGNLVRGNTADYVDRRRYNTGGDSGDSAGFLLVAGAHDNRIISNSFTHSGDGFFLGNWCDRASLRNYVYGNDGSFSPHNAFEATFSSGNVFDRNWANDSDYGFWLGYSHDSRVTRNEISRNLSMGIAIEHGYSNEIDRNNLTRNPSGVQLWANETACLCGTVCPSATYSIHHNNATLNTVGLSIDNTAGAAAWRNQLVDNGYRNVRALGQSTSVTVTHNNLSCSNSQVPPLCQIAVADEMVFGFDVSAIRNSWGTTNATTISALIFDHADDPSRGTVFFQPFLPEAIPSNSGTFDPGLGAWSTTTPLPQLSAAPFLDRGQQLIFDQGFVYLFGGSEPGNAQSTRVSYARLLPDGRAGAWTATTPLPGAFYDHVAVRSGSRVYLITGAAGATAVYQAPLLAGGGVGAWTSTAPLTPSRQSFAAVAYGGRLYASGGNSGGLRDFVKMATVQADGSLAPWQDTTPLPEPVQSHAMAAYDGFLYVIAPNGHVWKFALQSNGTAGSWQAVTSLPSPVISPAAFENDGYLYVLEGSTTQVLYAAINTDGTLGAWQTTAAVPEALRALRVGAAGGFVYAIGGWDTNTYRDTVRFAPLGLAIGCQGGEIVTAPFQNGWSGVTTSLTYQGLATIAVTGVGQASGTTYSDAFYLFAQGNGTPITPSHPQEWALALNGQKIDNFLVGGVPAYRPDHRYVVRLRVPAGPLTFGVSDGFGGDNSGQYTIGLCGGTP